MPPRPAQPSVAEAVRRVEVDLEHRRLLALVDIGVEQHLSIAQLAERLPAEESQLLARVLGSITAAELKMWLCTENGSAHLDAALGPDPEPTKPRRNGAGKRSRRKTTQPGLPGVPKGRVQAESLAFDRQVILLVAATPPKEGAKAGELKRQLECSRGKLRLSLERSKKNQWIRQKGELNGARYFATGTGLEFAEALPKNQEN